MTLVLNALSSVPAWAVYLIVGVLAFGESAAFIGLILPGETALLMGGMLAGTGRISLPIVLAVAIVAAISGDSVGYEIGRWGGAAIRASRAGRFVGEQRWTRAEIFVRQRGGWAVFIGRWIGLMRALVPALAGMTRMPYRRFLLFNAAGGTLWSTAVVIGGYLAGTSWHRMQGVTAVISLTLCGLIVAAMVARRAWPRLRLWFIRRPEIAMSVCASVGVLAIVAVGTDARLW